MTVSIDRELVTETMYSEDAQVLFSTTPYCMGWSDEVKLVFDKYQAGLIEKQKEILADLIDWYIYSGDRNITLSGSAGCGKSYCLQVFIKALQELKRVLPYELKLKVALAAPTHKAIQVLNEYAQSANIQPYIATIHSLLHVIPGTYDKDGKQTLKENFRSQAAHVNDFSLVCVDECSMIDEELFDFIERSTAKVLFLGDFYQLPPVRIESDRDESVGNDAPIQPSPTFTETSKLLTLTKPLRYDGDIAKYATAVRESMDQPIPSVIKSKYYQTEASNITILNQEDWENRFISMLKKDPLNVRAIAWTNASVSSLASKARETIYGDTDCFHIGEVLNAREMVSFDVAENGRVKPQILLHSCEECVVKDLDKRQILLPGTDVKIECWKLKLVSETKDFTVYTPTKTALEKVVKPYLKDFKDKILKTDAKSRGSLWHEYYDCLSRLCLSQKGKQILPRLVYAGTMTVHQAQGSGYKACFVNLSNIAGCQNKQLRARLIYTAITRSKEHLYILDKYVDGGISEVSTGGSRNIDRIRAKMAAKKAAAAAIQ